VGFVDEGGESSSHEVDARRVEGRRQDVEADLSVEMLDGVAPGEFAHEDARQALLILELKESMDAGRRRSPSMRRVRLRCAAWIAADGARRRWICLRTGWRWSKESTEAAVEIRGKDRIPERADGLFVVPDPSSVCAWATAMLVFSSADEHGDGAKMAAPCRTAGRLPMNIRLEKFSQPDRDRGRCCRRLRRRLRLDGESG